MQEKEYKPITKEFIEQFLREVQSHSGLPYSNDASICYAFALYIVDTADKMLESIMDEFINTYMKVTHELYMRNKTWKSYDW